MEEDPEAADDDIEMEEDPEAAEEEIPPKITLYSHDMSV